MHPILINFGPFHLATYGTFVAVAYLAGIFWLKTQVKSMPGMTEDKFWILVYGLFVGAILGGKILFILVSLKSYLSGEMRIIRDFRYGFVFFGGLLGAMLTGFFMVRWIQVQFLATADYLGVALPMGHSIGRLGCLGTGCCYGRPTTMPWGIALGGPYSITPRRLWGIPLHPTQLYEAFGNIAICLFLLYYLLPKAKRKEIVPGTIFLSYIILYSIARFINEFYRGDDRGWSYGSLYVSQWISIACILGASVLMARNGISAREK